MLIIYENIKLDFIILNIYFKFYKRNFNQHKLSIIITLKII